MRRGMRVAAAVLAVAVTAGCGLLGGDDGGSEAAGAPVAVQSTFPIEEVTTEPPTEPATEPSPSKTPRTSKSPKKPKVTKPAPTEDPNNFQEADCYDHDGVEVSKAKAASALVAAAGRTYWPTSAPKLRVSSDLVRSVAWHESGWQSSIVNCDGGRGLMQVMPDTETFVNGRFEQSYDSHDYRENAVLGANYLAWLTKVFGDSYFDGRYDLSPGRCKSHTSTKCLLNLVISGYNAGRGSVDEAYAEKRLPNPQYVDTVRSLMSSCYCDRY